MSKEEKYSSEEEKTKESILEFEDAKEMTIGQASRKKEELEAGVTDDDNVLDKYIKQHRQEIEAGKFEAKQPSKGEVSGSTLELEDLIREVRNGNKPSYEVPVADSSEESLTEIEELSQDSTAAFSEIDDEPVYSEETSDEMPSPEDSASENAQPSDIDGQEAIPLSRTLANQNPSEKASSFDDETDDKKVPFYKNKKVIYSAATVLALALIGGTAYLAINRTQASKNTASSSKNSSSKSSSKTNSSSSESKNLQTFNNLYDSFFTDKNKTSIKNSSFGNLEKLKSALDKLKGSREYNVAKAKYDSLAKQIAAIKEVNAQFETDVIKDGVINTKAKVKSNAKFTEIKTGNTALDKLISTAISQGKGQQTVSSSTTKSDQAVAAPSAAPANDAAGSQNTGSASTVYGGLSSTGVNLQRSISRVPYDQAQINDANNASWTFNAGILEKVLNTSRQRGYITGDQFILERVNIINGNGYYNLFKPDGTYLFSINCKTGYFVGNASGHSDALDY